MNSYAIHTFVEKSMHSSRKPINAQANSQIGEFHKQTYESLKKSMISEGVYEGINHFLETSREFLRESMDSLCKSMNC